MQNTAGMGETGETYLVGEGNLMRVELKGIHKRMTGGTQIQLSMRDELQNGG